MKEVDSFLKEAKRNLGMSGRPNKATKWYAGRHGKLYLTAAWCDMFVSWVAMTCGLGKKVGEYAYTPNHVAWFKKEGRWGKTPKRGAVVFFNWRSSSGRPWPTAEHVGIVEAVRKDGYVVTLEGNSSNAVRRKTRSLRYVIGYGYPPYSGGGGTKPTPYPGKIIYPGNSGNAVRQLKDRLKVLGYSKVKAGPNYGAYAVSAVKDFQKGHGLEVDGRVGPETWAALFA